MKRSQFFTIIVLTAAMLLSVVSGCSYKLPAETRPPEPPPTAAETEEPTEESTEPETSETSEETEATAEPTLNPNHGPFSTAVVTDRIVDTYGQLSVSGSSLVNEAGEPVQLRGMSSYSLGDFMNEAFIQTLAQDWACDIFRVAMYTDRMQGGCYVGDEDNVFSKVCRLVDLCIDQGIYVIIDWHILEDGDPNKNTEAAIDFFDRMSAIYGDYPNVIYEICNEPNGERYDDRSQQVDWECIKTYAEQVIPAIRANDPDNIIIVGTPTWSQDVDIVSLDPLDEENVMYTFHFYAGSHGQDIRDRVQTAIDNGLPIFVTEWGTSLDTGGGGVYPEETLEWTDFMAENNLSWCNWSIGGSVAESSNALRYNTRALTAQEKPLGHWPDEFISESGLLIRSILLYQEYVPRDGGDAASDETEADAEDTGETEAEAAEDTEAAA